MTATRTSLQFFLNGSEVILENADPTWTLLYYLREKRLLTGTKVSCGQGQCGSCTVMISTYDTSTKQVLQCAMNACLILLCSLDGKAVTTVEGVGSTKTVLHPLQEKLAKSHGTQCGFCSPGMIMSMYSLLRSNSRPSLEEIEKSIGGNLCRCTGYRPILQTFQKFADGGECAMGDQCCKNQSADSSTGAEEHSTGCKETSQEYIFPPKLKIIRQNLMLKFTSAQMIWWSPSSLTDLLMLRRDHPSALLGAGYTAVAMKQNGAIKHDIIALNRVPELQTASLGEDGIHFGAGLTMSQITSYSKQWLSTEKSRRLHYLEALCDILQWFGSTQIRNAATLGGHLAGGQTVSDLRPLLQVCGANVLLQSEGGEKRTVDICTGGVVIHQGEIITDVFIPYASQYNYCTVMKQSQRRELCIPTVNVAVNVLFTDDNTCNVKYVTSSCCGANYAAVDATALIGHPLTEARLVSHIEQLQNRPLSLFNSCLASSMLGKCLHAVLKAMETGKAVTDVMSVGRPPLLASQKFEFEQKDEYMDCGKPLHHMAGLEHTTGEARYIDDIPKVQGELFLCPVLSPVALGKLISIDSSAALLMPGVVDCVSYGDLHFKKDVEGIPTFVKEKVESQADVICAVLAESRNEARTAASAVKVKVEEYKPIITMQDAIQSESFHPGPGPMPRDFSKGDVAAGLAASYRVLEGEISLGPQKHFYLEPQSCIVTPKEKGEMLVECSTQTLVGVQSEVAAATGVLRNHVKVVVKRVGGGFGGKEVSSIRNAVLAATAAQKTGKPVRSVYDRATDARMTGGRNSMLSKYKVGMKKDGTIEALDVVMYWNCGTGCHSPNIILAIAMTLFEAGYNIPHITLKNILCKTNIPASGFFRGTGGVLAVFILENILDHVAAYLSINPVQMRRMHLVKENDSTIFGQKITDCNMQACWDKMMEQSKYIERRKAVDEFNRSPGNKRRGLAACALKYGLPVFMPMLNHGEALVHIYTDGSVYVAHGGVEIGQGLHTKCTQIASRALQVPADKIYIQETATNQTANCFNTGSSASTDLQGAAVKQACEELMSSLEPYKKSNPDGTWEQWVMSAHMDRAKLSASASFKLEGVHLDRKTMKGDCFHYFLFGAALCEAEVDCDTGNYQILRADIVVDAGQSINPAIDIGQIEGAFTHGIGLYCMEETRYDDEGTLLTDTYETYKIPGRMDVPVEFNVCLLPNTKGKAVYSSKGIGEPPMLLAPSTFFAIKDAISTRRKEKGLKGYFRMNSPMTNQDRLRALGFSFKEDTDVNVTV